MLFFIFLTLPFNYFLMNISMYNVCRRIEFHKNIFDFLRDVPANVYIF